MEVFGLLLIWVVCAQAWGLTDKAKKFLSDTVEAHGGEMKKALATPVFKKPSSGNEMKGMLANLKTIEKSASKSLRSAATTKSLRSTVGSYCEAGMAANPTMRVTYCDDGDDRSSKACRRSGGTWVDTTCGDLAATYTSYGVSLGGIVPPDDLAGCRDTGTSEIPMGYFTFIMAAHGCCTDGNSFCTEASGLADKFCPNDSFDGSVSWNECRAPEGNDDADDDYDWSTHANKRECRRAGGDWVEVSCAQMLDYYAHYISFGSSLPDFTGMSDEDFCASPGIMDTVQYIGNKCCGDEKSICSPEYPDAAAFCSAPGDYNDNSIFECEIGDETFSDMSRRQCSRAGGIWRETSCNERWEQMLYYLTMSGFDVSTMEQDLQDDPDAFCTQDILLHPGMTMRYLTHLLDSADCCGPQLSVCSSPPNGGVLCANTQDYTPEEDISFCQDGQGNTKKSCKRSGGQWIESTCADDIQNWWHVIDTFFDIDLRDTDPMAFCKQCYTHDDGELCMTDVVSQDLVSGCCGTGGDICRSLLPAPEGICESTSDFAADASVGVCSAGFPGQYQDPKSCRRAGGVYSMSTCDEWITNAMLGGIRSFDFDLAATDVAAYCAQTDPDGLEITMVLDIMTAMGCCGAGAHICSNISAE